MGHSYHSLRGIFEWVAFSIICDRFSGGSLLPLFRGGFLSGAFVPLFSRELSLPSGRSPSPIYSNLSVSALNRSGSKQSTAKRKVVKNDC